ncbi:(2Fe-2S)-binding protein [Dactylosporangium sp. CS-047395]|uniref:(2Fe-2S)-binding protein n=1 Tax=Dactylosporangium sp. CS-047395 TaxID=3239936 RepID=UPI003D8C241D
MTVRLALHVNGRTHEVDVPARRTLADALREDCGLTGTHVGCEHGVCGACTVLVDGDAVRSCLMFAVQCEGAQVRTIEGLDHPLQEAFSREHALQCGFCTPGFLMLAAGALEADPSIVDDPERLRELLTSNLCRCTGYEAIRRAVRGSSPGTASATDRSTPGTPH